MKRFLKNSSIVFAGSFIVNVLNYLFQLIMARILPPVNFGILAALISLFNLSVAPASALTSNISKFVSIFNARNSAAKISFLFDVYKKNILLFTAMVLVFGLLFSKAIANFLNIENSLLVLVVFTAIASAYILAFFNGFLSGLQNFKQLMAVNITNSGSKLLSGIILVLVGFGVFGATIGLTIGVIFAIFLSWSFLRKKISKNLEKFNYFETFPTLLVILASTFAINAFANIDMIFVKHFFSDAEAGTYSGAFILAKIIFYSTTAISMVLLPMASDSKSKGEPTKKILLTAIFATISISAVSTAIFVIFPQQIISILLGQKFAEASNYLGILAISTGIFCISNVLATYFISIHRKKFIYILLFFLLAQIAGFTLFHSNLMQIIQTMILIQTIMLFFLFGYYFINLKVEKLELN